MVFLWVVAIGDGDRGGAKLMCACQQSSPEQHQIAPCGVGCCVRSPFFGRRQQHSDKSMTAIQT
eukprot:15477791-Alexandrium_andersonii.AAC.1